MKIEAITYYILKAFGYIIGFLGVLGVFGFAGSLECDTITIAQFIGYEFHAFCLIGLSFIVYILREMILDDCRLRYRAMKRKAARIAARRNAATN
jgi:uncharacterized membrane protein